MTSYALSLTVVVVDPRRLEPSSRPAGQNNMASSQSEKVDESGGGFTCCVPDCFNNSKKCMKKISFHVFPKDEKLREMCLRNIFSNDNFVPTSGHQVCGEHFKEGRKTYLDNVPTVFPHKKVNNEEGRVAQLEKAASEANRQEDRKEVHVESEVAEVVCDQVELQVDQVEQEGAKMEQEQEGSVADLNARITDLEKENEHLRNKIQSVEKFGVERYALSDSDMLFYTGFALKVTLNG